MKGLLILALGTVASLSAWAKPADFDGLVQLSNGQKIYCQQFLPAGNAPTVVLLNGLTYTTKPWQKTAQDLADQGFGVLLYDMRGMGKTLEATGPATDIIPLQQQVDDLVLLLQNRHLNQVELAGLSYGGAVAIAFAAQHPESIDQLVLMAPYVKALKAQDDWILQQIKFHRTAQPNDPKTDDQLYDEYLKQIIYQTYPIFEPVVKEHPWRLEAVYQMVRGVRKFVATDVVKDLPNGKTHLVVAGKDQYVPAADHAALWDSFSAAQKESRLLVEGSEHKLPEAVPHFLAGWLSLIGKKDSRLTAGREFDGNPVLGTATAGAVVISDLPKN